jgi:hypothetical protein
VPVLFECEKEMVAASTSWPEPRTSVANIRGVMRYPMTGRCSSRRRIKLLCWVHFTYRLAWCSDQRSVRNDPNLHLASDDADITRASQLQHPVEDIDHHVDFGHPTFVYT